jgi:hypothetical protein
VRDGVVHAGLVRQRRVDLERHPAAWPAELLTWYDDALWGGVAFLDEGEDDVALDHRLAVDDGVLDGFHAGGPGLDQSRSGLCADAELATAGDLFAVVFDGWRHRPLPVMHR